jgi:chromosome partitioning protein
MSGDKRKIISFVNQKGGTGKTTTAVNVAALLAIEGKRTLMIDLDPQSNATMALVDPLQIESKRSVGPLLLGNATINDVLISCNYIRHLDLIPATLELSVTELELSQSFGGTGGVQLQKKLKKADYEYIICDCPPNFGLLTSNALVASTHMIVPMEPEIFAMYGLQMLMTSIIPKIGNINEELNLLGIILVRVNPIRNLTATIRDEVRKRYGSLLFDTEIPIDVRLPESQRAHLPVVMYAKSSRATEAYKALTKEILDRIEKEEE